MKYFVYVVTMYRFAERISKFLDYVRFLIIFILIFLAVLLLLILFSRLSPFISIMLNEGDIRLLLGDVLLIMIILELADTLLTFISRRAFYLRGVIIAVMIAICRHILFIEFNETLLINAISAAILILALLLVLKFYPPRIEYEIFKSENIKEIRVIMEDKPGSLAKVCSVIAKNGGNIISGSLINIGENKGQWYGLIHISEDKVDKLRKELKELDVVYDIKIY